MSVKRKSSASAGFSHLVELFIGRRDRPQFTDRIRSSPAGVYNYDAGEPICTTIESWECSAVIGESGMRGGGDDLSSIILADQLATNSSPGSNVASPISSQSACGHWNGRKPGGGTIDSSLFSCAFSSSVSSRKVIIGLCLFSEECNKPSSVEPVSEAGLSPVPRPAFPQFVVGGSISPVVVWITDAKVTRLGVFVLPGSAIFGKQSLGTSPGAFPDDGIAIRRCVS